MLGRNQRRGYSVINRSLQYRFLAIIIVYSFVIVLFLAVFMFVPEIMRLQDQSLPFDARAAAADKMLTLHARVWPAILLVICLVALHSFRFFHRLIGPLYRFRQIYERVRNGELNLKVKIRKKDYLHEEEAALNDMLETLSRKWRNMQQTTENALRSLDALEQTGTHANNWKEDREALLRVHRHHLETLAETSRYFTVPEEETGNGEETPEDEGTSS
ncbi:MAG: methyl-accepting chemotaxis protein [Deltaproteobacteria bacterium]|nr:MAG: methyl-accepting chemotaxis protein [Deltaproteobacteria bacterium]